MEIEKINKHLCIDLHGIINAHPVFFSALTNSLVKDGWQITVATGSHISESSIEIELEKYDISYTHLYSIADYHRDNETEGMWYDTNRDPWVSDEDWDKSKAEYCKKHNVLMCIDDTARYANHFETPFGYMAIQTHKNNPNRYLTYVIEMFKRRTSASKKQTIEQWFERKFGWFFNPSHKCGKSAQNRKYI